MEQTKITKVILPVATPPTVAAPARPATASFGAGLLLKFRKTDARKGQQLTDNGSNTPKNTRQNPACEYLRP